MNVEYKARITGDISGLEKVLQKANGSMKQITDKDFVIKLDYDGNVKALNKTLSDAIKACPELAIQFQYDVNKKALEQKLNDLQNIESLKIDLDAGKVQRKVREMVSDIQTGFESGLDTDDVLKSKIEKLYKYANSAAKAGADVAISFDNFEDIDQHLDGFLTKISKTPQYFGDMSKGINDALENTKTEIAEIQKQLDFFKSKGAVDMSEGFDKTEEEIDETSKKLKELVDGFEDYYKKKKGLNAGNYWKQLKQQIDDGDESLKELLADLKLLDDGTLNLITAGNKNQGGIIGEERVAIARKNDNNQYEDTLALKKALDEAYDAGVNVARIMDVIGDESHETFVEIQERATGKMLAAYGQHTASGLPEVNPDFLEATDEQIQKLIKDILVLQKLGINAEAHPENLIYDRLKGFQFIDLDLNPTSYVNSAEMIEDAAIRIAGDIEDMYDELGDSKGLKAVQSFGDKFRSIGTAMAEVYDAAEKTTEETQDSHSPSKVAEKLGEEWTEGYAEGIKKHKGDVEEAVRELVEAGKLTMQELVDDLPNILGSPEYIDLVDPVKNVLADAELNVGESSESASDSVDKATESEKAEGKAAEEATKKKRNLADAEREVANESEHVSDVISELPSIFEEASGQTARIEGIADAIEEVGENAKESAEDIAKMGDPAAVRDNALQQAAIDAQNKYRESIKATSESLREQRNLEQTHTVNSQKNAGRTSTMAANVSSVRDLAMQQEIIDAQKKYRTSIEETTNAIIEQTNAERNLEQYARRVPMTSEEAFQQLGNELSEANIKTKEFEQSLQKVISTTKEADASGSSLDLLGSLREGVVSDTEKSQKAISGLLEKLEKLNDSDKYVGNFIKRVNALSDSLEDLSKQEFISPQQVATLQKTYSTLKSDSGLDINRRLNSISQAKYLDQISKYLKQYSGLSRKTKEELNGIAEAIRKANSAGELKKLYEQFLKIKTGARDAGEEVQSMFTNMKHRLDDMNAKFFAQFFSFQDIIRYIRELSENVIQIDTALTELRKVSDASTSRLQESFQKSSDTALELGQSIQHVVNVTADWARLGYNVDQAEELARITALFTTVGDNMSSDDASSYLISTLQGYQMAADEALDIVDKYNQVANNFAIDTAGIGEALQRSAASFNAANTDLSESIALITATNEVVQNPESVGTLWKTMSARIRGAKTELEELGEEEDDFTQTTSKLRDLVKGLTGFDIMKNEKEFKSIYDIILGIGEAWDNLSDIEQASLGEALAGKRNANALFAVLGNLDTLQDAYAKAEKAAGSAEREQENYAKSIQYSLDRWQASIEKISTDLLNSDFLKSIVESGVDLLGVLDGIVTKTNGLTSVIAGIGTSYGFMKIGGVDAISSSLRDVIDNYAVLSSSIEKYNTVAAQAAAQGKTNIAQYIKADGALGKYLKSLNGAQGSMKGYTGQLIAAKAATIGLNIATAALNAAISVGISVAVTFLVSKFSELIHQEEEARRASVELAEAYESESEAIDDEIAKYEQLHNKLKEAIKEGEDTYSIKEQLASLQDTLNQKYGEELDAINLVNGAYEDQIAILKNLSIAKADKVLSTNADQINDAFDYLTQERYYTLGEININDSTRGLLPILEKYGIDTSDPDGLGYLTVQLHANIEDADEAMTQLFKEIEEYGKTHNVDVSSITDVIPGLQREIASDEEYKQAQVLRRTYVEATLASNNALSKSYEAGVAKVEAYNKALESGEGIEKAKEELTAYENLIKGMTFDSDIAKNEALRESFLSIFDGIDKALETRNTINEAFAADDGELMKYAEKLRGMDYLDFLNPKDSQTQAAINYLLHSMGLASDSVGLLHEKLVELKIAKDSVTDSTNNMASAETKWASERDKALEKLGLVKETSSGKEYDDSWSKYLETIKQLNPELANNQVELEKCALANMQFSKAVDDLSKNFKTYKAALQDADKLTPEFSDAINSLADDLTYLTGVNFSIEDAADFLSVTENIELLEQALNGSDEALQRLQQRAAEAIHISVDFSELEQLEEYTQIRIALGFDTETFNADIQNLANWINENQNMGEIDVAAMLDANPFLKVLGEIMAESSEVAQAVKAMFDSLGWDVDWKMTKMKVITDQAWSGQKNDKVHVSSTYGPKGASQVNWVEKEVEVPTNIRYIPNGGSGSKTSTSKYTPKSLSPSQKSSAASNLGKGSSSGSSGSDKEKEDDYKETIDFFERLIKVLDQQIDLLDAHLQDVVGSFAKNTLLDAQEDKIKQKMAGYTSAIEMYSAKASEALSKVPSDVAAKLQSGAVAIDEFVGEENKEVVEAAKEYEGWADKVADCKQQLVELREELRQLELQKFKNVAQDFQELFDVRQTQIDLISKAISLFESASDKIVGRGFYDVQIDQTAKQLDKLYEKRVALINQANSAMANGIDVASEEWFEMLNAIEDVNGAILDSQKNIEDYKNAIVQLYVDAFDRESNRYTNQIALRQKAISALEKQISIIQSAGNLAGTAFFEKQIEQNRKSLDMLQKERQELMRRMSDATANGVRVGTDEWYNMVDALNAVDSAIQDCEESINSLDDAILALHTATFERIQSRFESLASEMSNMTDMFEGMDVATVDNKWTKEGLAQLGLLAQQYELAKKQVAQYNTEIEELNSQYAAGKYSVTEYTEKLAELKSSQWEEVKAAKSAKDSIISLNEARVEIVVKGINEEIEAYQKLIDEQKKLLSTEKDLHDYEKSISKSTQAVQDVERQLAALADDNSLAAAAKRAKLEEELRNAREDLAEQEYAHSVEVQQEALDEQLENYRETRELEIETLQESLENEEQIIQESFDRVKENTALIGSEILTMAQSLNITMSEEITAPWQSGENAIASYSSLMNIESSNFIMRLNEVENSEWRLQEQANNSSVAIADMFANQSDNLVAQTEAANAQFRQEEADAQNASAAIANAFGQRADSLVQTIEDARNSTANLTNMSNALADSLSKSIDGSYSGASAASALESIADAARDVGNAASEAVGKVRELIEAQSEYSRKSDDSPNVTTVYGGPDAGKTASWKWDKNGQIQITSGVRNHYAQGTKGVSRSQLAWTQEDGPEAIINPSDGSILTPLQRGSAVLPADQTSNIWQWSRFDPETFAKQLALNVPKTGSNVQANTLQIGNLVNVSGNVNDTMEMMQIAATTASAKIKQSFNQLSNGLNK